MSIYSFQTVSSVCQDFESFSCSLRALAAPLSLALSADPMSRLHFPFPESLTKLLSDTRACTDHCSTPLEPSFHLDNNQLIAFLCGYIYITAFLSRSHFPTLLTKCHAKQCQKPYCSQDASHLQLLPSLRFAALLQENEIGLTWFILDKTKACGATVYLKAKALPLDLASKILPPLKYGTELPASRNDFTMSRTDPACRSSGNAYIQSPCLSPTRKKNCIIWCYMISLVSLVQWVGFNIGGSRYNLHAEGSWRKV